MFVGSKLTCATFTSVLVAALFLDGSEASAQTAEPSQQEDIFVTGKRRDGDIEALRHFDRDALRTLGVNSIADLISRLGAQAKGTSGADPVCRARARQGSWSGSTARTARG